MTGQAYAFTGDDPLNATDPSGLIIECRSNGGCGAGSGGIEGPSGGQGCSENCGSGGSYGTGGQGGTGATYGNQPSSEAPSPVATASAPPIVINLSMFEVLISASAAIEGERGRCTLELNQTGLESADAALRCSGDNVSGSISADGAIQGAFGSFGVGVAGSSVGASATASQTSEIDGDQVTSTITATFDPSGYSGLLPNGEAAAAVAVGGSGALALWWLAKVPCTAAFGPAGALAC